MSQLCGFRSRLGRQFVNYLALKRALGRKYLGEERTFRHLDQFLSRRFPTATDLSVAILEAWLTTGCNLQPQSRATQLTRVRQFCLYRRRTISTAFLPNRLQHRALWPNHISRRRPIILSKSQIQDVLRAALTLRNDRRRIFFTILLLLYTTGLRRSEAMRLRVGDLDLEAGTLRIRDTKFYKTRLVPVARDVLVHLRRCVGPVSLVGRPDYVEQPLFQLRGKPLSASRISYVFTKLLRALGLKPAVGRSGGRLHDLRATFAVHRIEQWYAEGADVQNRLPALSTYMGHKNIASTQYYVAVTPELLKHASQRFERACAPRGEG